MSNARLALVLVAGCSVRSATFSNPDATKDASVGDDADDGGSTSCDEVYSVTKPPSVITFLVDRSGSMSDPLGGTISRWQAVRAALVAQGTGFVHRFADLVDFGAMIYDSDGSASCPDVTSVVPNINSTAQIDALMNTNAPRSGSTVTGEAIAAASAGIDSYVGAKVMVVLSDGDPVLCAGGSGVTNAISATTAAYNSGIQTLFVSVGTDMSQNVQQQLANAGVGLPTAQTPGAPLWRTASEAQLAAAIEQIIAASVPCSFKTSPAIGESDVTVRFDGLALVENAADGWMRMDANTINLVGSACESFRRRDTGDPITVVPACAIDTAVCGDSIQQPTEACDDGNLTTEVSCPYGTAVCRACSNDCSRDLELTGNVCGDSVIDPAHEVCESPGCRGRTGVVNVCNPTCTAMMNVNCGG